MIGYKRELRNDKDKLLELISIDICEDEGNWDHC